MSGSSECCAPDCCREVRLPAPGDDHALQEYVGRHLGTLLPPDRPLWDIHLVEGLAAGSAIYIRLHHALADGIALTRVLLSLTDAKAESDGDDTHPAQHRHHALADAKHAARRAALDVPHLLRPCPRPLRHRGLDPTVSAELGWCTSC